MKPLGLIPRVRQSALTRGVGSNGISFASTLLIQVVTVPLFVGTVGVDAFAAWLVIAAVPTYLSISDLGFASTSATEATRRLILGDRRTAFRCLTSAWLVVVSVGGLVAAGIIVAGFVLLPIRQVAVLGSDAPFVLMCVVLWAYIWLSVGFVEGAFRADNQYPLGINCVTAIRLFEFCGLAVALLSTGRVLSAAIALLACRFLGVAGYVLFASRRITGFGIKFERGALNDVRLLWRPSLSFVSYTVGYAAVNQGTVLVAAWLLSAYAVALFSTTKTLVNLIAQITAVVNDGSLAEITRSFALGAVDRARGLCQFTMYLCLAGAAVAGIAILLLGIPVMRFWTGGHLEPTYGFLAMMVISSFADVPLLCMMMWLRARNEHGRTAIAYTVGAVLGLALGAAITPALGLIGLPVGLLLVDVAATPVAVLSVRQDMIQSAQSDRSGLE